MKDETKKFLNEYVEKMYPLLELLDVHNLNMEQLMVTPTGEELTDGKVYFQVERRFTNELKKILTEEIMSDYGENQTPQNNDTYYVGYDTCDKLGCGSNPKDKGGIIGFAIERNGKMYLNDIVGDLIFCMSDNSNVGQTKNRINKCADDCYNAILNQLRKLVPINGSLLEDALKENLYIHRRAVGDDKNQDYIINDWQNFLSERKDIKWINFWETDNMFIALE